MASNESDPDPVDSLIQQAVRDRGLGELEARYGTDRPAGLRPFGCGAVALGGALIVAAVILLVGNYSVLIKLPIAAVIAVGTFLIFRPDKALRNRNGRDADLVFVYTNGFVRLSTLPKTSVKAYHWSDVTSVNYVHSKQGSYSYYFLYVKTSTGPGFNLEHHNRTSPEIRKAIQVIRTNYDRYQVGQALTAVDQGTWYPFGKVRIGRDGLLVKDKLTPWAEVTGIEETLDFVKGEQVTAYRVARRGGKGPVVTHHSVPSTSAFVRIVELLTTDR